MPPRKKEGPTVPPLESLPNPFRRAIVKLMAKDDLELEEALEQAAALLDPNGKEFDHRVSKEAQRLYKSRFMSEMNVARSTFQKHTEREVVKAYDRGYDSGLQEGQKLFEIWYFCSICGKKMTMYPNAVDHQAMIGFMKDRGWSHGECLKTHSKK